MGCGATKSRASQISSDEFCKNLSMKIHSYFSQEDETSPDRKKIIRRRSSSTPARLMLSFPRSKKEFDKVLAGFYALEDEKCKGIKIENMMVASVFSEIPKAKRALYLREADLDKNQVISKKEYLLVLAMVFFLHPFKRDLIGAKSAFEQAGGSWTDLDSKKRGFLNQKETKKLVGKDKEDVSVFTEERFHEMDWDKNGDVSFKEFFMALLSWMGFENVSTTTISLRSIRSVRLYKKESFEIPIVIFVVGGPGAGKGTQCAKIVSKYGCKHLSTGDLLRAERKRPGSKSGRIINDLIKEGKLVPSKVTVSLLKIAMDNARENENASVFLVDGFPRSLDNLQSWDKIIGTKYKVATTLYFTCKEDVMIERLLERAKTSGRSDDNEETIKKRLETFNKSTLPVLKEVQEMASFCEIDCAHPIEKVFSVVCEKMDTMFKANRTLEVKGHDASKKARVFFIVGGPGTGKGTQCASIVEMYKYKHLSTGDLLRAERKRPDSKYGAMINNLVKEGKLVPSELCVTLLKNAMNKAIEEENASVFLVDGFPRSIDNLDAWEKVIGDTFHISTTLFFTCPENVMVKRLLERAKTSGRSDDNEETIKKRLRTFNESTMPVLKKVREMASFYEINCARSVEDVFTTVSAIVDKVQDITRNPFAGTFIARRISTCVGMAKPNVGLPKPNVGMPKPDVRVLFIIGGPGAGKGTQCAKMVKDYGFKHLSTGDLLRTERKRSDSKYGAMINSLIKEGKLVPSDVTVSLLKTAMDNARNNEYAKVFLVDGFPRSIDNLQAWDKIIGNTYNISSTLFFTCPEDVMLKRLLERAKTSGRSDDNEETIKKRLKTFNESTVPVIDKVKQMASFNQIDCAQTIERVYETVVSVLEELKLSSPKLMTVSESKSTKAETKGTKPKGESKSERKVLFIIGGPGAGKGPQCAKLVEKFGFEHFSTGDLLRAERKNPESKDGEMINNLIREGKLVPSELCVKLLKNAMDASDGSTFLVDGFPRSIDNLQAWDKVIGDSYKIGATLFFTCPEDVMVKRLLERAETSGRSDDNEETIKKRLKTFNQSTMPVLKECKLLAPFHEIQCAKPIEEVFDSVCAVLGEAV
ncbi:hypothetical protein AAMO2058_000214000 [Amorphochlora amoebiformis]